MRAFGFVVYLGDFGSVLASGAFDRVFDVLFGKVEESIAAELKMTMSMLRENHTPWLVDEVSMMLPPWMWQGWWMRAQCPIQMQYLL